MEVTILFWVKHLEQSRSGVALEVLAHLVNLVKNNHRVATSTFHHGLDNASGHSTNVSTSVTTNLGLVMKTSKRDALILAVQCLGYRAPKRCFANARRTIKADYRSLEVATQF